jgi:hypothetical protein
VDDDILSPAPRHPNTEAEVRMVKLEEFEAKKAEMKKLSASFGLWGSELEAKSMTEAKVAEMKKVSASFGLWGSG